MGVLLVTLDTSASETRDRQRIADVCQALGVDAEIAHTTVTDRETEGTSYSTSDSTLLETAVWSESRYDAAMWSGTVIRESFVIGESRFDEGVLGEVPDLFEQILHSISNGSFPKSGQRENLTTAQRHQLRDAMVLEAHHREGRDVFVTRDVKGFINHGRRELLEKLCSTRIVTVEEFCTNPVS